MQTLLAVAILFASMNSILLVCLIYLYARIVMKTRAGYAGGLMIFSTLLLAHNLLTVSSYFFMMGFFGWQVYPWLDAIAILEFGGLIALFKVTL
jgi:hypothetical protein